MASPEHLVIGMTGGVGCGKTTASRIFAELGVRIIDADEIAHALSRPPSPALQAIAQRFGPEFLTPAGEMNRDRMRERVFAIPEERKALEAIFHPQVMQECRRLINQPTTAPYTILSVPLLFETKGFTSLVRRSLVIDCSEEIQILRVMARSGLSQPQVLAIMATQIERNLRLQLADDVICNEGTPSELAAQIRKLHQDYSDQAKI